MALEPIDGRRARAHRTRAAIVEALLDLIEEGTPLPTAVEVAARANVALRSIRQHFDSRETLFLAASQRHAERIASVAEGAAPPEGSIDERVRRLVAARARVLEATSAIRRSAALREESSPALAAALRGPAGERRREVERTFAAELARVVPEDRASLLDALDVVTSGKAWDALRREMGRSPEAAEHVMQVAVTGLLRGT